MANDEPLFRAHICLGKNCSPRGGQALLKKLESEVREAGLTGKVDISATSCRDRCDFGPSMNVYPGPVLYNYLTEDAIEEIVLSHFLRGRPVERYRFKSESAPATGLSASATSALDRMFGDKGVSDPNA